MVTQEIYFEDASLYQAPFLTQLALDSNDVYGYRIVPDDVARQIFQVTEEHFNKGVVRVMIAHSEIAGFYALVKKEKDGGEIQMMSHLYLKSEMMSKGHGTLLFQEAMRAARDDLHWKGLLWGSDPHAAGFYQKMGAVQVADYTCPLNPAYKSPVFIYIL